MTPDRSPDSPAPAATGPGTPAPRSTLAALQQELVQLVADLDARYWRSYHERADDPYRKVRTARALGGAGNFGGGRLDDAGS